MNDESENGSSITSRCVSIIRPTAISIHASALIFPVCVMNAPFVSVIIPAFNDFDGLQRCLQALEQQTYPADGYEIIVVDNNSTDNIEPVVAPFPHVRLSFESIRSSYAARNKGISLAKGEVLAFTDADCIPAPDWLSNGVTQLLRVDCCGLVAGRVQTCFQDPAHPTAVELYDSIYAFPQKAYVEHYKFGVTANLFTFKQRFEQVGLFDQSLKSGGDYDWGWRVHSAGYPLVYADNATVQHPGRRSLKELSKKVTRVIQGHYELKKRHIYPPIKFVTGALADLLIPFRSIPSILLNRRLMGSKQKLQVIGVTILIRYVKGWERLRLQIHEFVHGVNRVLPLTARTSEK